MIHFIRVKLGDLCPSAKSADKMNLIFSACTTVFRLSRNKVMFRRAILIIACVSGQSAGVTLARPGDVVAIARAFPDGGGYEWKGTGVPEDVRFADKVILAKGKATYCSGFTFAVAMKAASERGLLKGKTVEQIRAFQKEWYGANKESGETQCAYAMEKLGIGKSVAIKDAKPGDFLQLWRMNKSGHSVVFLEWVTDAGKPIGIKYRSTQTSTNGIGDRVESFADIRDKKGSVDPKRLYFCRLNVK
jgi:hypothetical protein